MKMNKYVKPTIKNLKKHKFEIKNVYLDDYTDNYDGKRKYGQAIAIVRSNDSAIFKTYSTKRNLYKDLARARKKLLDLYEFLSL